MCDIYTRPGFHFNLSSNFIKLSSVEIRTGAIERGVKSIVVLSSRISAFKIEHLLLAISYQLSIIGAYQPVLVFTVWSSVRLRTQIAGSWDDF